VADEESRPPVGTVAEEAARLLDALGGWAATAGYAAQRAPRHTDGSSGGATDPAADAGHPAGHCDRCGAADGAGQAVVCSLCPVCQAIGLLRSVRPETVDRLADLAGAVAGTLRDLADRRRHDTGSAPTGADGSSTGRAPVQDIPVEDGTGS